MIQIVVVSVLGDECMIRRMVVFAVAEYGHACPHVEAAGTENGVTLQQHVLVEVEVVPAVSGVSSRHVIVVAIVQMLTGVAVSMKHGTLKRPGFSSFPLHLHGHTITNTTTTVTVRGRNGSGSSYLITGACLPLS